MTPDELTIRHAQTHQPWTVPYSAGVDMAHGSGKGLVPHILGSHCVLHAVKSVGKIAALFELLDHTGDVPLGGEVELLAAMSADLVTAALRFANLYGFDLASVLCERIKEKNHVDVLDVVLVTPPIDMVLPCPWCGTLHIDKPEPENGWDNPPHRSHLCHGCKRVWRPADVPTNGVARAKTRGEKDTVV